MKELKQLTIEGLSWNLKNQFFSQVINLIVGIILVRLLSPKDFGIVAMVLVFSAFVLVFRDLGLSSAVIQKKNPDDITFSSVFWTQVFMGLLFSVILYLSAPFIVLFYNEPLLEPIVIFLSLEYLISTVGILQFTRLQKELNYRRVFYINLLSVATSSIIAISMAYSGFKYWSLIAKSLSFAILNTSLVWIFSDWKPMFRFNIKIMKQLFGFSLPLLGNQILNYGVRNIDDLLIGKVLGQQALGFYNRSYTLMLLPLTNISNVIANVLFPSFSLIQDEPKRIKSIYLKVIRVVALITFPLMIGLFVLADPFVKIVFGSQWIETIPIIKILSILGLVQSIGMYNGIIFLSSGKTMILLKIEVFAKLFMIGMIIFGLYYMKSIEGVALFYAIGSISVLIPTWYFMGKLIDTKISEILNSLSSISIVAILMGVFLYFVNYYFFQDSISILTLLFQIILGAFIYWLLLVLLGIKAYINLKVILTEKFKKSKGA